ncbi:MAG: hypothetical protein OEZ19_04635 [Paracoccaceae bacterium]|nr:hypothetical protein [Paracoccaceae bacterium]
MNPSPDFWGRVWRHGEELARDNVRHGARMRDLDVGWALLCEAFTTSARWPSPPYQDYPTSSPVSDLPDDATWREIMAGYLSGDTSIDTAPDAECKPPLPSAAANTRAEAILALWRGIAPTMGANRRRAITAMAMGVRKSRIIAETGMNHRAMRTLRENTARRVMDEIMKRA